ncbi:MAG: hypothetical protein B6I22_02040 [Desulfobacteraceae bacterium 4572_123]|nr:MAG: hypothetical protein B6I22_02040 [Desulfobacteraceae bacterium 4572_123]
MNEISSANPGSEKLKGILCGVSAFLIWGLSPLYWKLLSAVPALEIINHRIIWSFLFLIPLLVTKRRWGEVSAALLNPRTMPVLLLSSIIVAFNWLLYIWAVNNGRVLQTRNNEFCLLVGTAHPTIHHGFNLFRFKKHFLTVRAGPF